MKHFLASEVIRGSRLAARVLTFALLLPLLSLASPPEPSIRFQIDRLFLDHVECFWTDSRGQEIYISSRERLYHSSNYGRSWKKLGSLPDVTLIKQIIPISPSRIFVNASKGFCGTAYLSVDSGRDFCECVPFTGRGACAAYLRDQGVLYVAAEKPFRLMESRDSGVTWSAVGLKIDTLGKPVICSMLVTKTSRGTKCFVSTSTPATIYSTDNLGKR